MDKRYFVYVYIFITFLTAGYFYHMQKQEQQFISEQLSGNIIFTGNIFTGTLLGSGDVEILTGENINPSEYEKYSNFLEEGVFKRSYNPPAQPSTNGSTNYSQKSDILNNYLKDNNFYFRSSEKLSEGYLYIKLYKSLKSNGDIFIYFYDTNLNGYPVSGKLIKSKNLIYNNTQEYLYNLTGVYITKFYDGKILKYDWLSTEINKTNKLHFIGGYLTTSDGNYIKEISIVGK